MVTSRYGDELFYQVSDKAERFIRKTIIWAGESVFPETLAFRFYKNDSNGKLEDILAVPTGLFVHMYGATWSMKGVPISTAAKAAAGALTYGLRLSLGCGLKKMYRWATKGP